MSDKGVDDRVHDLAPAYAVDALDESERTAFEAHLPACVDCADLVQELREAAVELTDDLEVAPPPDLRRRVLQAVAADQATGRAAHTASAGGEVVPLRVPTRPARWVVAAAAALVVVAGGWGVSQVVGAGPAERIVVASDAREHSASTDVGIVAVISSADRDAAVLRLPEDVDRPPEGRVYQAWFVGADGSARSAGVLTTEELEEGDVVLEGTPEGAAAVGLTLEPAGGSEQPTTEPFAVVPLS